MVGKKSSLKVLARVLKALKVSALFTTEFMQGRTSRWGIAWSFVCDASKVSSRTCANALEFRVRCQQSK